MPTAARDRGSLLEDFDLDKDRYLQLLELAAKLKLDKANRAEMRYLDGAQLALVFEKNSTRTRCAFEVAIRDQGGAATYLGPSGSHVGREESIPDTAQVLGRMFDGIAFRGFSQDSVTQLADFASVPVWNALTDAWHPTQLMADVLTMAETAGGRVEDISCCFVGDGRNNVARSLLATAAVLGFDARIAAPRLLQPPPDVTSRVQEVARRSGARITLTHDPIAAVREAQFVYTDVWVSMGEPDTVWAQRVPALLPYRVTAELLHASGRGDTRFLHCLPAIHNAETALGARLREQFGLEGAEVTDDVFRSAQSLVFEQAENRMHTIKALLVASLGQ
jgi:ornithine carbamoyltransferase